jgi:hypothetical protein
MPAAAATTADDHQRARPHISRRPAAVAFAADAAGLLTSTAAIAASLEANAAELSGMLATAKVLALKRILMPIQVAQAIVRSYPYGLDILAIIDAVEASGEGGRRGGPQTAGLPPAVGASTAVS